jgi:hypothetical protein
MDEGSRRATKATQYHAADIGLDEEICQLSMASLIYRKVE